MFYYLPPDLRNHRFDCEFAIAIELLTSEASAKRHSVPADRSSSYNTWKIRLKGTLPYWEGWHIPALFLRTTKCAANVVWRNRSSTVYGRRRPLIFQRLGDRRGLSWSDFGLLFNNAKGFHEIAVQFDIQFAIQGVRTKANFVD